ncbi:hypothetical protein SMMN14_04703 [Sphaerulina musiva]
MGSSSETPVSPLATRGPDLTFTIPAINAQPVELDSTPTSPEKTRRLAAAASGQADASPSSLMDREHLKQVVEKRKADPAVLQDIPQLPGPHELEKVEASHPPATG